jgi:hypothetical protein
MSRAHEAELSLSATVLGIPFRLVTNSLPILEMARATYAPADAGETPHPRLQVRVLVTSEREGRPLRPPIVALPEWHRLELDLFGGVARADAIRGEAEARVSNTAAGALGFREWVLDHLVLFLVTNADRIPLHVAGVVRHGKALLLAGPSGRGKSSLTYAAMNEGWQVLADDAVYLQRRPERRLWSIARDIHLPRHASRHFPELAHASELVRADGRAKIAVPVPSSARAPIPWSGSVALCLLGEASGGGRPERVPDAVANDEMRATLQGGFSRFADAMDACTPWLTEGGCWRLPRAAAPRELARRLDELLADG